MEQLKNSASTTLNGGINDSTTSVTVTDGSVFPSSGNFRVLLDSEIMVCTSRSGNTLTVTRGAEGTSAASHANGVGVEHLYTKGSVEQILNDFYQVGGYASRPASARKSTVYHANDLLNAKWLYNGTNWDLLSPSYVPYANRTDFSGWTAVNHGSQTFTDKNGILHASLASLGQLYGYTKALPTAPYKITLYTDMLVHRENNIFYYLGWRLNSSGAIRALGYQGGNAGSQNTGYIYQAWSTATTFTSNVMSLRNAHNTRNWLRIEDDNTNWKLSASKDGMNFSPIFSETRNTGITADHVFVGFRHQATFSSGVSPVPRANLFLLGYKEE